MEHTLEYIKKETTGRIMSVDFGDTRTGLALSDISRYLASGIGYVSPGGIVKTADKVAEMVKENRASAVIVGLPKNMDGSEGARVDTVRAFADILVELTKIPIDFCDERMSTMAAYRFLDGAGTFGKKRKAAIDTLSAELILQNYIDKEKIQKCKEDK